MNHLRITSRSAATSLLWFEVVCVGIALLAAEAQPVAPTPVLVAIFLLASVTQQIFAAVFFVLRDRVPVRRIPFLMVAVALPMLVAPLMIPAGARIARMFSAMFAVVIIGKLWDARCGARRGTRVDLPTFLYFLPNPTVLVIRKAVIGPASKVRLVACLAIAVAATVAIVQLASIDWRGTPFIVEHGIKVFLIFSSALGIAGVLVELARLGGVAVNEFSTTPLLATTPADFWRRYNQPVQQFFFENMFRAAGGMRWPVRTTLAVFAISGLAHEYMFTMALGRVQGFQLAFFMVQGLAVVATFRLTVPEQLKPITIVATFAFNLVTSVLFFASAHNVIPIYVNAPQWLTR